MTFGTPKGGGNAYTFAHVLGIPMRVQPLFLLLVGFFLLMGGWQSASAGAGFLTGALHTLLIVVLVAVSVLLHELGHALAARHYGIEVVDITLWPLGGVAMLRGMPDDPKIEGVVSIMGPAVNFAIAALLLPVVFVTQAAPLPLILVLNLALGTFNLLPAFPMDGGKLLRAFLARRGDWLQATERAVRVGRWVAAVMIFVGIFGVPGVSAIGPNLILALIGLFVISAGTRELWHTRARYGGGNGFAGSIGQLMRMAAEMQQRQAGGAAGPAPGPMGGHPAPGPIHDVSASSTSRPKVSGFSEEDIRRLEGFHGRLRRPDAE